MAPRRDARQDTRNDAMILDGLTGQPVTVAVLVDIMGLVFDTDAVGGVRTRHDDRVHPGL